jgi:peptidoglycan/xylan/chitin deacetylase (PgdA/CDA1 family)
MNRRYIYIHYLLELFGLVLLLFKLFIPDRKLKILSIHFHDPSPRLFERIINYLDANNYRIISLKQFNDIIDKKQLNEKIAVITIDDGWQNNIKLLDVVKKYNVYITIFVTTSAIEQGNFWFEYVRKSKYQNAASLKKEKVRIKKLDENSFNLEILKLKSSIRLIRSALTKKELIQLSKEPLVTIGSHTVRHLSLPYSSYNAQKKELINSKIILERWTNQKINYFSYPSGDYSDQLKILAKECGYELCFSTETSHIELNKIDKFSIPRRCVNDNAGFYEALSKIYGIWYKIKK